VVFESGKINEAAFESEGRYLIANRFLRFWRGFANRFPQLFQNLLDLTWEARDIFIYCPGRFLLSAHIELMMFLEQTATRVISDF